MVLTEALPGVEEKIITHRTLEPRPFNKLACDCPGFSQCRHPECMTNTSISLTTDNSERGAATAEYAIATVAAAGFAGLLAVVLKSNPVQNLLTDLISGALSIVT